MILTTRQKMALRLRRQQKLSDREIGQVMGIRRESANRLISAATRRILEFRKFCARGECDLIDGLLN